MKVCSTCGNTTQDEGNYCPHCGQSFNPATPAQHSHKKAYMLGAAVFFAIALAACALISVLSGLAFGHMRGGYGSPRTLEYPAQSCPSCPMANDLPYYNGPTPE